MAFNPGSQLPGTDDREVGTSDLNDREYPWSSLPGSRQEPEELVERGMSCSAEPRILTSEPLPKIY